jgi:deazaflavin-dependent oxidoreductase (nitroreductase family)
MSFNTPAGTRGARVPRSSGPLSRRVRRWMSNYHRRKSYTFMGMDVLFLTTIGKKTGERRETPVAWFPDGDDAWLIVASAAGSARNPDWYHNIAAHPDQVWIELPRQRKVRVTPEQLEGARRGESWRRIVQAQPRYAKYQEKTDRLLPVIRLVPSPTQP